MKGDCVLLIPVQFQCLRILAPKIRDTKLIKVNQHAHNIFFGSYRVSGYLKSPDTPALEFRILLHDIFDYSMRCSF